MDEHPQDSDTPVTSAQTTDKQDACAVKVPERVQQALLGLTSFQNKGGLGDLLQTYLTKCNAIGTPTEINHIAQLKAFRAEVEVDLRRLTFNLNSDVLHLDGLSTLLYHDLLLAQSKECVKRQVQCNARERSIHTMLGEIAALEAEIMANYYASELKKLDRSIRARLTMARTVVSKIRLYCLNTYWGKLSGRL
jgi:hypothetical protein